MQNEAGRDQGEDGGMKFSEDVLKTLNLEQQEEREPVNVMQVADMLLFMKTCAERIVQKSRHYMDTVDAEVQMDCMDIVTAKLNDYAQVFKDLIIFMRMDEKTYRGGNSLRYCISAFDSFEFQQTDVEKRFLQELLLRNEITHDYFNRELHQQKLIWIMQNCSEGAMDVYRNLNEYLMEHGLLDKYVDKAGISWFESR